nr:hypothetical protein [Tanacetum cinerariifolium]GFD17269.1 hypothetical protein [Tanacetum cinerariifolium]
VDFAYPLMKGCSDHACKHCSLEPAFGQPESWHVVSSQLEKAVERSYHEGGKIDH